MIWIILFFIVGLLLSSSQLPNTPQPRKTIPKKTGSSPSQFKTNDPPKPVQKTSVPSSTKPTYDWKRQEADNQTQRQQQPLKAMGDAYELHIGRRFEQKGDLVIYNGFLRGYTDQGVDLIVISKQDQVTHLIQCKHWKRYEFTLKHLNEIYRKLSQYRPDYASIPSEAIRHYLAISMTDAEIQQHVHNSQVYVMRKTLYLASVQVIAPDALGSLTKISEQIYRFNDMKLVINAMN